MARTLSAAPLPPDLSSNWKRLQQHLKKDTSAINPEARRADCATRNSSSRTPKRLYDVPIEGANSDLARHKRRRVIKSKCTLIEADQKASAKSLAAWAVENDIPAGDIALAYGQTKDRALMDDVDQVHVDVTNEGLSSTVKAGKYIAIDCEMVGVGPYPDKQSALARVSIVNYQGQQLYDSFVLPKEPITDYRTAVSGITAKLLRQARSLEVVQRDVVSLVNGKILVGHALQHDLAALLLGHPSRDIRDTSRHPKYRALAQGRTPALKRLARQLLGIEIQGGEHSSIEDARATMMLFRQEKVAFDQLHRSQWGADRRDAKKTTGARIDRRRDRKLHSRQRR